MTPALCGGAGRACVSSDVSPAWGGERGSGERFGPAHCPVFPWGNMDTLALLVPSYRKWHTDLLRGACLLVSMSLEHEKLQVEGGVRAVVLTSQYLIEPCGLGQSKVTHVCRADLR